MKKALITGIFGQDGSYLCELLTHKGYEVHGIVRENLSENSKKIKDFLLKENIEPILHHINLHDFSAVKTLIKSGFDEIYHLAALHQSSQAQNDETYLFKNNIDSTANILEACLQTSKTTKIILAGSCLMFDNSNTKIQTENTPVDSCSLYGIAKITANMLAKYYIKKGIFVCSTIFYNHESSRRKNDFLTKKIVKNLIEIKKGKIQKIHLGNILIKKDWGYAKDYVEAMYLMAQQKLPSDFIISSGKLHSIEEFIEITAKKLKIMNWRNIIETNSTDISRNLNTQLLGDSEKAYKILG